MTEITCVSVSVCLTDKTFQGCPPKARRPCTLYLSVLYCTATVSYPTDTVEHVYVFFDNYSKCVSYLTTWILKKMMIYKSPIQFLDLWISPHRFVHILRRQPLLGNLWCWGSLERRGPSHHATQCFRWCTMSSRKLPQLDPLLQVFHWPCLETRGEGCEKPLFTGLAVLHKILVKISLEISFLWYMKYWIAHSDTHSQVRPRTILTMSYCNFWSFTLMLV